MDLTVVNVLLTGAGITIAGCFAIIAYFLSSHFSDYKGHKEAVTTLIGELEKDMLNVGKTVSEYKLHVSETYAKQSSIARLHDIMETGFRDLKEENREIRDDIKTLLSK